MVAILILSTADFHSPVWTNKQHLAAGLAKSFDLGYVESIGLRRPTATKADLVRIVKRFMSASKKPTHQSTPENITIIRPKVIPFHGSKVVRALNRKSLVRTIEEWKGTNSGPYVLWSFSPLSYSLEDHFDASIYHSVDLLHHIPGIPTKTVLDGESDFLMKADAVVSSSVVIASHLNSAGRKNVLVWENVADTEVFIPETAKIRKEQAIFAGNLTPSKVDFDLLRKVADQGIHLVLVGPISIDGQHSENKLKSLLSNPNVEYLGNKHPSELAYLLNQSTVGLIPYLSNSYTEGVFPMKVYEYLASGLSVVSTDLPSLRGIQDEDIVRARDHEDYLGLVGQRLAPTPSAISSRKLRSATFSWTSRVRDAVDLVESLVA